jgi:hypothetical protein
MIDAFPYSLALFPSIALRAPDCSVAIVVPRRGLGSTGARRSVALDSAWNRDTADDREALSMHKSPACFTKSRLSSCLGLPWSLPSLNVQISRLDHGKMPLDNIQALSPTKVYDVMPICELLLRHTYMIVFCVRLDSPHARIQWE